MVSAVTVLHWRRTTYRLALFVSDRALAETTVVMASETEVVGNRNRGSGGRGGGNVET